MGARFSGRCLCGEIHFVCAGEPVFTGNCHCKDCQRTSGSAFTPALVFPERAVQITGTPRYFKSHADSGRWIERGFCPTCGAQLFAKLEALPEMLGLRAGTLDDATAYRPTMNFYVASAQPWDHMDDALPRMPGSPVVR